MEKGLVQVYTGNGKGKTTASLGLALRAVGHGFKVCMVQFMKGDIEYGEIVAGRKVDGLEIHQFGRPDFVDKDDPDPVDVELAREGYEFAKALIQRGEHDLVILDEINVAVEWNLLAVGDVLALMDLKPETMELVLTGRYARQEVIERADLVTEMKEIKHPYQKGMLARDGIEH